MISGINLTDSITELLRSTEMIILALLERTKKALPNVKLIICEPFAVKGVKAVDEKWYPEFYDYQKAARDIADTVRSNIYPFSENL